MAELINIRRFEDSRGVLSVLEAPEIPFDIKRVFFIHDSDGSERAGHRHHEAVQAVICLSGKCDIFCDNGTVQSQFSLSKPSECLVLHPEDWHLFKNVSSGAIILVLASTVFDEADYIFEPYQGLHE